MQDINKVPMVDVIAEVTGREVVMRGAEYVFFDTKENVSTSEIEEANLLKEEKDEALSFSKSKEVGEVWTYNEKEYQIPFMKDDADGVVQVTLGFMNEAFTETVIAFTNGTKLPITKEDFNEFAIWFANKRNSYFKE